MAGYPSILLHRTANQSVNNTTDTAISWDTEVRNTGPASWWNSNDPTLIHMPYVGRYLLVLQITWAGDIDGMRNVHWNRTQSISSGAFEYNTGNHTGTTDEETAFSQLTEVMELGVNATCGQIVVWHSAGAALNMTSRFGTIPAASIGLTYLGA